ncbi:MAG: hypothetical protein WKF41_14610 [Gaiellaceae bacterium]
MARSRNLAATPGAAERLLLVLTAAAGLAAVDLNMSRTDDWIAFNAADVFVLVGVLLLMPALMSVAIHHRDRLRPPSRLERRLHRWLGL